MVDVIMKYWVQWVCALIGGGSTYYYASADL